MIKKIEDYLEDLKKELKGSDPSLIQDALSDAEEHLRNAFEEAQAIKPDITESEALPSIIEKYGTPKDTASAYLEIDEYISSSIVRHKKEKNRINSLQISWE